MPDIVKPQQGILFMKVGVHAKEDLESIIKRKIQEIEEAGFAFWGYGGGTCHPTTMVQPFVKQQAEKGQKIYLCMHEMKSNHFAEPLRAEQYSVDGITWNTIPKGIDVLGSRFALAIKELRREEFILPLNKTQVAVGDSQGRSGHQYVRRRVDKACLQLTDEVTAPLDADDLSVKIDLVAELCEPYAVLLRN